MSKKEFKHPCCQKGTCKECLEIEIHNKAEGSPMSKIDDSIKFLQECIEMCKFIREEGAAQLNYIQNQLTKIKAGYYIPKEEVLSDEEIKDIICQDILADIPDDCKSCSRKEICDNIIKNLSGKVAKAKDVCKNCLGQGLKR